MCFFSSYQFHCFPFRCTSKFCRKFNDSPNFVENKVFSGALPSTSTANTASTSRIDDKSETKFASHLDGNTEAQQKVVVALLSLVLFENFTMYFQSKLRTRSGLGLVKEEKMDSQVHPSISESKPSVRVKRGRPASPPKKKLKKEVRC